MKNSRAHRSKSIWRVAGIAAVFVFVFAVQVNSVRASRLQWQGSRPDGAETLASPEEATAWLSARGYFWPEELWKGDTLLLKAGPRAEVGSVHVGGDTSVPGACLAQFKSSLQDGLDTAAISQALHDLVTSLVNVGRPYSQVRLLALDVSRPPLVDLELAVYSGPEVFTGSLVTGASRTEPRVFEREAGWRRGALLKSDLISSSEEKLSSLSYVAGVDSALLVAAALDTADVYLGVKEAPGIQAGGVLGWVPGNATTDGYWAGEFNVQLRSAFGDGRQVGLTAARPDPQSQRTHVHYWEPWPFGAPLWFGVELAQDDYASDFIETSGEISVRLATDAPRWQFQAGAGRVTLEEDPSASSFPADYLKAGIVAMDSNSSSAYRFEFDWSTQHLRARDSILPPQERLQFTQGQFAAHRWWPLLRNVQTRGLVTGAGTLLSTTLIPEHLLYRVGGVYSLRGYREQQFAVRDYLRAAWEIHFGSRQQSLFVFAEGAWLNMQAAPERILGSAGLGLRVAGRLEIMAAVPNEGGLPETKIHLRVVTSR